MRPANRRKRPGLSAVWASPTRRVWPRPSLAEIVLAAAWLALVSAEYGNAIHPLTAFLVVDLGAFLLGMPWLVRLAAAVVVRIRRPRRVRWPARDVARWLAFPAALALAITVGRTNVVFQLRFAASRPALEAIASSVQPGARLDRARRVGLFWVSRLEADAGVTRLTTGNDAFGSYGVAYCPEAVPRDDAAIGLAHVPLVGPWWTWSDDLGWRS